MAVFSKPTNFKLLLVSHKQSLSDLAPGHITKTGIQKLSENYIKCFREFQSVSISHCWKLLKEEYIKVGNRKTAQDWQERAWPRQLKLICGWPQVGHLFLAPWRQSHLVQDIFFYQSIIFPSWSESYRAVLSNTVTTSHIWLEPLKCGWSGLRCA